MMRVGFSLCVLVCSAIFIVVINAQADGNPHHWDRKRRCDHTDYSPPCGPCEGIGGLATGDDNSAITIPSCTVVSNASGVDPSTLIKPVWGQKWQADNYNEILIGPKRDPFCFQIFPGNTSDGTLCYRHDSGSQTYDMSKGLKGPHTLLEDLTLHTVVGDVASKVIHQGQHFWVVNRFPWYAAGVHQCICTEAHEGADKSKPGVYPVQYDWTQQMFYIGREKLGIEYLETTMVLDHWAFGPHHVWSKPETGETVRFWQPFNGLQVFTNGTNNAAGVDPKAFDDIPPALCKKGGATFRIKCTDAGLPQNSTTAAQHLAKLDTMPKNTKSDLKRAKQVVPGPLFKGDGFKEMSDKLNQILTSKNAVKMCGEFSAQELQELSAMLYLARDTQFDSIYQGVRDNRRLRGSLADLQKKWAGLNALVSGHPDQGMLHEVQRDGHCHEVVMWYVHHLSEDVKQVLAETGVEVPLLSYESHAEACAKPKHAAHAKVCDHYQETVTCASCHSNTLPPSAK